MAALFVGAGVLQLPLWGGGHSLIEFGFASILLGGGLWMLSEWMDALENALTPGVLLGLPLLGVGWNQLSAAGGNLL
ncbi:MAG: hypothetical protein L3K14_08445 [Thermoplasmata archaeon]|nr:hypothetical protein [Thermoplasmata archaeon]